MLRLLKNIYVIAVRHKSPYSAYRYLKRRIHRYFLFKKQKNCQGCGSFGLPNNPLTVDHIIPLARGGPDTYENKQVLCRKCNLLKGDGRHFRKRTMLSSLEAFKLNSSSIAKGKPWKL